MDAMIEATWIGGPNDGAVLALPDDGPIFLISAPNALSSNDILEEVDIPIIRAKIEPVFTDLGWRLYYNQIQYADPDED